MLDIIKEYKNNKNFTEKENYYFNKYIKNYKLKSNNKLVWFNL